MPVTNNSDQQPSRRGFVHFIHYKGFDPIIRDSGSQIAEHQYWKGLLMEWSLIHIIRISPRYVIDDVQFN